MRDISNFQEFTGQINVPSNHLSSFKCKDLEGPKPKVLNVNQVTLVSPQLLLFFLY